MLRLLALSCAVLPWIVAPQSSEPVSLVPRAVSGEVGARSVEETTTWTMKSMELAMDGAPYERQMPEVEGENTRRIVIRDRVAAVDRDRILELERTFEDLHSHFDLAIHWMEGVTREVDCASPVAGKAVRFAWSDAEQLYDKRWKNEEDVALGAGPLSGLTLEPDFLCLLPASAVAVGERWKVDLSAADGLFRFGGDLGFEPIRVSRGNLTLAPTPLLLACALGTCAELVPGSAGSIEARLTEIQRREGTRLARIAILFDLAQRADRTEVLRRYLDLAAPDRRWDAVTVEFDLRVEGEGALQWDLEAGCARDFEAHCRFYLTARMAWPEVLFGSQVRMSGSFQVEGSTSLEYRAGS